MPLRSSRLCVVCRTHSCDHSMCVDVARRMTPPSPHLPRRRPFYSPVAVPVVLDRLRRLSRCSQWQWRRFRLWTSNRRIAGRLQTRRVLRAVRCRVPPHCGCRGHDSSKQAGLHPNLMGDRNSRPSGGKHCTIRSREPSAPDSDPVCCCGPAQGSTCIGHVLCFTVLLFNNTQP